ncbi:MAG TPA: hypothetical protein VMS22_01795 [Candidatus Eisenbacteria bacterium]|nr:hypothetical protein [Candidatus Eisenbacteria bacterium]
MVASLPRSLTFTGRIRSFSFAIRGVAIITGQAKDVAAGAVLIAAAGASIIGVLVLGPHVVAWVGG